MEVLGWSPSGEYEEIDVCAMFRTPSEDLGDWHPGQYAPAPFDSISGVLSPGFHSPSSSSAASPYYRAISQRRLRDPDHIPRPRNSFIIFRCDYTREHCGGAGDRDSSDAEKRSLSKRAGEAWKKVPADVKKHYKKLADQEREEHARRNPDYRFRPRRRQPSRQAGRPVPKEKVQVASAKHAPQTKKSPRSRSSSFSSVESPQSSAGTVSPRCYQNSMPPTPSSSDSHLSSSSRQSSPESNLVRPTMTPESPYTPLDSPAEHTSCFAKSSGRDPLFFSFSHSLDAGINDVFFNYDDSPVMISGRLSRYAGSGCYAPAVENHLPAQMTIPGNESHAPPPLEVVASSLAGWNGDASLTCSNNQRTTSSPGATFEYEYQHFSPEAYPTLDGYVTAGDSSYVDWDIQNNLNAYALGLTDHGIGYNASGFDLMPPLSP